MADVSVDKFCWTYDGMEPDEDGAYVRVSDIAALSANNQERAAGTVGVSAYDIGVLRELSATLINRSPERHNALKRLLAATSTTPADEGAAVKEVHMPHRCIKPHCPADCSGCNHTISGRDEARNLICDMLDEFANDGHGATFEDGEHPLVDRARAYLFRANAEFEPLYATPQPPTAEPVDPAYPFYELKFIMRVLSHKGGAPKQDWDTAYGMAREIFSRWHKDRQSTAEGQPNRDWDHIDDVLPVIELMRSGKWVWGENMRCKYVEVRIDTRDGGCIIKDRHDVRITPAELVKQFDGRGGLSWTEYDEIF